MIDLLFTTCFEAIVGLCVVSDNNCHIFQQSNHFLEFSSYLGAETEFSSEFGYQLGQGEVDDAMSWSVSRLVIAQPQEDDAMTWGAASETPLVELPGIDQPVSELQRPMPALSDWDTVQPAMPYLIDLPEDEYCGGDQDPFGIDPAVLEPIHAEPLDSAFFYQPPLSSTLPEDPAQRREALLSNVPLLRNHLALDDVILVAIYVNGPCELKVASKWVKETDFTDITDFANRQAGPFSKDSHLAEPYRLYTQDGQRAKSIKQLTELGIAAAELLLGYPLFDRPRQLIQRLPLSYRLRYCLHHQGAMTSSEYSRHMVDAGLNDAVSKVKKLTARNIISACSSIKASQRGTGGSLFSVNNIFMNRIDAIEQWSKRVLDQTQRELGMRILEQGLLHYANHDLANAPAFHLVDEAAFNNFIDSAQNTKRVRARAAMPAGTLIPVACFQGLSTNVPNGMTNAARFSLVSFPFIPGLELAQFYMARTDVDIGQSISLDTVLTLQAQPTVNERKMTAGEITSVAAAAVREAKKQHKEMLQLQVTEGREPPCPKRRSTATRKQKRDASPKRRNRSQAERRALELELQALVGPAPVLVE